MRAAAKIDPEGASSDDADESATAQRALAEVKLDPGGRSVLPTTPRWPTTPQRPTSPRQVMATPTSPTAATTGPATISPDLATRQVVRLDFSPEKGEIERVRAAATTRGRRRAADSCRDRKPSCSLLQGERHLKVEEGVGAIQLQQLIMLPNDYCFVVIPWLDYN